MQSREDVNMGSVSSRHRASDSRSSPSGSVSPPQAETRRVRRRSMVNPPSRSTPRAQLNSSNRAQDIELQEESTLSKISRTVDRVDEINKTWDMATYGFIGFGLIVVVIFVVFAVPALKKLLEKAQSH